MQITTRIQGVLLIIRVFPILVLDLAELDELDQFI